MDKEPSSFRDTAGQVFKHKGFIFRNIHTSYKESYDHLMASGLYKSLVDKGLLVSHQEIPPFDSNDKVYKTIMPEQIPFISYLGEWSFGQLKDAALTTLDIQIEALNHGMVLKDASAFNIQFVGFQPKLIDTLSFEIYQHGNPWQAYKQFCEHFLSPLVLLSKVDSSLHSLWKGSLTGVPLPLAAKLLPFSQKVRPSIFTHIVMHSKAQKRYEGTKISTKSALFSKDYLLFLAKSLKNLIESLTWGDTTTWGNYYDKDVLPEYLKEKETIIEQWLTEIKASTVWDLGANNGTYSQIAARLGANVRAMDVDLMAVEKNYQWVKKEKNNQILPLVFDLSNPTPSIGWALQERMSIFEREKPQLVLVLGLIHHLVITEGVPLEKISSLLRSISKALIIEFIPKNDPKVIRLLQNRPDVFEDYTESSFLNIFEKDFVVEKKYALNSGVRTLFLLKSRENS